MHDHRFSIQFQHSWRTLIYGLLALNLFVSTPANASNADKIVDLLNTEFGGVCSAELEGWFTKTLKIDWTSKTSILTSGIVLKNIADVKQLLYDDGVRYLKIPNDAGVYNIFDWETGEKSSVSERAPYYFSN